MISVNFRLVCRQFGTESFFKSFIAFCALHWRHNEPYGVSNHQPHHCLFRRRSTVYSDADQRKLQSSASLAFVWGIHRDRWIPYTNGKCFHLMTSSCELGNEYISMTGKANYAGFIVENYLWIYILTLVTIHIWVNNAACDGLSPFRCQVIARINAGLLSTGPQRTNWSKVLSKIQTFLPIKCIWNCRLKFCYWVNQP